MNKDAQIIEIAAEKLIADGVRPEADIPLWFNSPLMLNNERLIRDFQPGLTPFSKSVEETAAYYI